MAETKFKRYRLMIGSHVGWDPAYAKMSIEQMQKEAEQRKIDIGVYNRKGDPMTDRQGNVLRVSDRHGLYNLLGVREYTYRAAITGVSGQDIIETDEDLLRYNGAGMTPKFVYLDGGAAVADRTWNPAVETLEQFTDRMRAAQGIGDTVSLEVPGEGRQQRSQSDLNPQRQRKTA